MDLLIVTNAVLALVLKVVNVVIHSIGLYLLRSLQKNGRGDENMIYLTSLSVSELLMNIVSFVRNLLKMIPLKFAKTITFEDIVMYSYIGDYTILKFSLYMTMVLMALDRMCLVLLNISYPRLWNKRKAKICIWCIWIASIGIFIISSILYSQAEALFHKNSLQSNYTNGSVVSSNSTREYNSHLSEQFADHFFLMANYTVIVFNLAFVITAVVSYGLIFHIFRQKHGNCEQGVWEVFKKSKFYVPLLIILSNILFIIPPDFIWTFIKDPKKVIQLYTTVSYAVAYLSDGLLYIFMNDKVRTVFYKKLRKVAQNHNNSEVTIIREFAIFALKKIPPPERESSFSRDESRILFNRNRSFDSSRTVHGSITTSVSSVEMHGVSTPTSRSASV